VKQEKDKKVNPVQNKTIKDP